MERIARVLVSATVLALASGCATKDWVERELERRDARLDRTISTAQGSTAQAQQHADLAQQQLSAVDQRVGALEARSYTLEAQSSALDKRAAQQEARSSRLEADVKDASARAAEAGARAEGVDARLTRLWSTRNARTVVNVLQVQFGFDRSSLDDSAKSVLFALARELRENPEISVDLEGYTDSAGNYYYNIGLSQRRIDAVMTYLVERGVERHRIRAAARGPAADAAGPEERKRRVDIKMVIAAD
jgi:outer membrane protein OmpA-like peptidoglycan-associated protein